MAGFASGVIDSWQYLVAGIAGLGIGKLVDHFGWGAWLYGMAGFGIFGGILMMIMRSARESCRPVESAGSLTRRCNMSR